MPRPIPPQLDFWHPVALSRELKRNKPLGVKLLGTELVVFRTADAVGCLTDICPHRGMRLSTGSTEGGRLVCPYHGYSYDRQGTASVPGSPKRSLCATHFDALERCGAIWIKRAGATAEMPRWTAHLSPAATLRTRVNAPLELVLDNFTEVEHTATTHAFLGYRRQDMAQVTCELELTAQTVRVINAGPQRPMPRVLQRIFQFQPGDEFVDDWTTWFTPPHAVYDHFWRDPQTHEARPDRLVTAVHINPVDDDSSDIFAFVASAGPRNASLFWRLLLAPLSKALVSLEVERDRKMIEQLADRSTGLQGKKLSRFDKALAENRKRLDSLYWGREPNSK